MGGKERGEERGNVHVLATLKSSHTFELSLIAWLMSPYSGYSSVSRLHQQIIYAHTHITCHKTKYIIYIVPIATTIDDEQKKKKRQYYRSSKSLRLSVNGTLLYTPNKNNFYNQLFLLLFIHQSEV